VAAVATKDLSAIVDGVQWPLRTVWDDWCRALPVCQPGNRVAEGESKGGGATLGETTIGNIVDKSPTPPGHAMAPTAGSGDVVSSSGAANAIVDDKVEDFFEAELAEDSESDNEIWSVSYDIHGSLDVDGSRNSAGAELEAVLVEDAALETSSLTYSGVAESKEGTASDEHHNNEHRHKGKSRATSPKSAMKATSNPAGGRLARSSSPKVVRFGDDDGESGGNNRSSNDGEGGGVSRSSNNAGARRSGNSYSATLDPKENGPIRIERRAAKQQVDSQVHTYLMAFAVMIFLLLSFC